MRGLVRAVFATETLALGINMPARTVVLERLTKFNGETHADVTPGEYTQLTGRAGRRGIDVEGHAVVLWSPEVDPQRVAGLASTRTYPLRSSFRPSYNMAVNLVDQMGRAGRARPARVVVRAVPGRPRRRRAGRARSAATRTRCAELRAADALRPRRLRRVRRPAPPAQRARGVAGPRGAQRAARRRCRSRWRRCAAVTSSGCRAGAAPAWPSCSIPACDPHDDPRPLVVTEARWSGRLSTHRLPRRGGRPRLRCGCPSTSTTARRRSGATWPRGCARWSLPRRATARREAATRPTRRTTRRSRGCGGRCAPIPCHQCPDREEHARWAERHARLGAENDGLRARIEGRTGSLGTHVRPDLRAARRARLSRRRTRRRRPGGSWRGSGPRPIWSSPSACAPAPGTVSTRPSWPPSVSTLGVRAAPRGAVRCDEDADRRRCAIALDRDRRDLGRAGRRRGARRAAAAAASPSSGSCWAAYRWAQAASASTTCSAPAPSAASEMTAGDFIRWCKQVLDLLDQLGRRRAGPGADGHGAAGWRPPPVPLPPRCAAAWWRRACGP